MVECLVMIYVVVVLNPIAVTKTSDIGPVCSKEFLDIQETIECKFTLKCMCDMRITCSQMHRTDK